MTEYHSKYFDKNEVCEFRLPYPVKSSNKITELRKEGNNRKQYVVNVYYCDTLRFSYDKTEVYSSLKEDDYSPVYSSYHSDCEFCQEHKRRVNENLIIGFIIYPKGVIPKNSYKERVKAWEKFK